MAPDGWHIEERREMASIRTKQVIPLIFSILSGAILLAGLVAQVAITVAHTKSGNLTKRTLAWNAVYGTVLLVLSVLGFTGLLDGQQAALGSAAVASVVLVTLSWLTVGGARGLLIGRLSSPDAKPSVRRIWQVGLLVAFCLLSILTIEMPWSHVLLSRGPSLWWLELALVALASTALYFLSGRRGIGMMPAHVLFGIIGIAQYFVRQFKNSAILPNDLLVLGTAASVGDQYTYSLDPRCVVAVAASCLPVFVMSLLVTDWTQANRRVATGQAEAHDGIVTTDEAEGATGKRTKRGLLQKVPLADLVVSVALTVACVALVTVPNYMSDFNVEIMYWYSIRYYERQGFLPTFIAIWQDMPIRKPEGYDKTEAEKATKELSQAWEETTAQEEPRTDAVAQFEDEDINVIVVMNESFSDLSEYSGIREAGYKGPQFFDSVSDALFRGKLYVNVHGGGTCNSEFEFLTGNSLGYIGAGKYPYSSFQLDAVDNLARQLGTVGYGTTAIHPNWASNWNRSRVYHALGFDRFLDINDFGGFPEKLLDGTKANETPTGVPVLHSGVTDKATYERILELLNGNDSPQFVFDVTMQNHGSYNQRNIPKDILTSYVPDGVYDNPEFNETADRLNEYLSCIEASDRDLEWFMEQLRSLDKKVVLVFFGDHQPSLSPAYNDAWYTDEDDLTHSQRIYHADYLVWANYDVAGSDQVSERRDISVDALASSVLEAIGAPLSKYQEAQLETGKSILATNLHGYMGANGVWYTPDAESDYEEAYGRMALVEYLNFAERI